MKRLVLVVLSVGVLSLNACSGAYGRNTGSGVFSLHGDAKGIEAFGQTYQAIIEGSKTESGAAPVTTDLYKSKAVERTKRLVLSGSNPLQPKEVK